MQSNQLQLTKDQEYKSNSVCPNAAKSIVLKSTTYFPLFVTLFRACLISRPLFRPLISKSTCLTIDLSLQWVPYVQLDLIFRCSNGEDQWACMQYMIVLTRLQAACLNLMIFVQHFLCPKCLHFFPIRYCTPATSLGNWNT